MLKKILIGSAIAVACAFPAISQMWLPFPQVGGSSFCASTVQSTCVSTIPAGPSVITGNETIPADTNLSGGVSPQTVKVPLMSLGLGAYSYQLVVAGAASYTYTVPNNVSTVMFDIASGAISQETVTTPAAPVDGQMLTISSRTTITTFALSANTGQSLAASTPTVLTASTTVPQGYKWFYRAADTKWYRIQ